MYIIIEFFLEHFLDNKYVFKKMYYFIKINLLASFSKSVN